MLIEVCKCGAEVSYLCPDALAWCSDCDQVVEGKTEMVSEEDFNRREEALTKMGYDYV